MLRQLVTARSLLPVLIAGLVSTPEVAAQRQLVEVVDSIATQYVDGGQLAGMSVAVTQGVDTLLFKSYGYADLEWRVAMPTDAIYEIGSVTKQFTSVAMLQLAAEGKLDLDADITAYLPDYDTQGRRIPLRRLFDHTSGIKGYTEMASFGRLTPQALPRDTLVSLFEAEPFQFEPGNAVIYNNSAYFLLGLIIESVSGQTYQEYLEDHVFPLAGMDDTSYCTNDEVWERRAHGYSYGVDGIERAGYLDHRWPYSAGSLCSTIGDLVEWNRSLHGGEVLRPTEYETLITPRPLEDGTPLRYAMGISNYETDQGQLIGHGGGILGFVAESRYYPADDLVVVVLINTNGPPGPGAVASAVAEHLLGSDHAPEPVGYDGDLSRLEGFYRGPGRGPELRVTVSVEDGALRVRGGPFRFEPQYMGGARSSTVRRASPSRVLERIPTDSEWTRWADIMCSSASTRKALPKISSRCPRTSSRATWAPISFHHR